MTLQELVEERDRLNALIEEELDKQAPRISISKDQFYEAVATTKKQIERGSMGDWFTGVRLFNDWGKLWAELERIAK